jgi:hypothetical protein
VIGKDSSANPIAGLQNGYVESGGMKFAPSGETRGPSADDQYIDGCFGLHDLFAQFLSLIGEESWDGSQIFRQFSKRSRWRAFELLI